MNEPANDGSGVVGRAAHGLANTATTLGIGAGIGLGAYFGGKRMLKNYRKEPTGKALAKKGKGALSTEEFFKQSVDSGYDFNKYSQSSPGSGYDFSKHGNQQGQSSGYDFSQHSKKKSPDSGYDFSQHDKQLQNNQEVVKPKQLNPNMQEEVTSSIVNNSSPNPNMQGEQIPIANNTDPVIKTKYPDGSSSTTNGTNDPIYQMKPEPRSNHSTYNPEYIDEEFGPRTKKTKGSKGKGGKGRSSYTRNNSSSGHLFTKGPNARSGGGFFKKLGKVLTRLK